MVTESRATDGTTTLQPPRVHPIKYLSKLTLPIHPSAYAKDSPDSTFDLPTPQDGSQYVVVADLGSTGSRGFVYELNGTRKPHAAVRGHRF